MPQACAFPAYWVIQADLTAVPLEGRGPGISTFGTDTIFLNTETFTTQKASAEAEGPTIASCNRGEVWQVPRALKSTSFSITLGNLPEVSQHHSGGICEGSRV